MSQKKYEQRQKRKDLEFRPPLHQIAFDLHERQLVTTASGVCPRTTNVNPVCRAGFVSRGLQAFMGGTGTVTISGEVLSRIHPQFLATFNA